MEIGFQRFAVLLPVEQQGDTASGTTWSEDDAIGAYVSTSQDIQASL